MSSPSASGSSENDVFMKTAPIVHHNYPVLTEKFVCPETEFEKMMVVCSLPGGAQDVKVDINDSGTVAIIKYRWAKNMYNVEDPFKVQIESNELSTHHPMSVAFKAGLANVRKKIDAAHDSMITLWLPIKVQTPRSTWKKWAIKRDDGSLTVMAIFTGFAKEYLKKESDEKVVFM